MVDRTNIDVEEVQRLVLHGFNYHRTWYLILQVESKILARAFLSNLSRNKKDTAKPEVPVIAFSGKKRSWASGEHKEKSDLSIAFTYAGMDALDLDDGLLREPLPKLANSFVQGAARRSSSLGDTRADTSRQWEPAFKSNRAHIVISIHGNDKDLIKTIVEELKKIDGWKGLSGWSNIQEGKHRGTDQNDRKEHFGFVDGISQPVIRRVHNIQEIEARRGYSIPPFMKYEAGEFLLGHPNEVRENRWREPLLSNKAAKFYGNGSFAAFRKMEQDVAAYRKFIKVTANQHAIPEKYLEAKLCGRNKDGTPLVNAVSSSADLNSFGFRGDADGRNCPIGSHIRRLNPRDDKEVIPRMRRPVIRRGIPYGKEFEEFPDQKRGLLGMFFCASLEQQFEFLMQDWVDETPIREPGANTKDPLIGNHEYNTKNYVIPVVTGKPIEVEGIAKVTRTRGMLYLFYPSRTALSMIAELDETSENFIYKKPDTAVRH